MPRKRSPSDRALCLWIDIKGHNDQARRIGYTPVLLCCTEIQRGAVKPQTKTRAGRGWNARDNHGGPGSRDGGVSSVRAAKQSLLTPAPVLLILCYKLSLSLPSPSELAAAFSSCYTRRFERPPPSALCAQLLFPTALCRCSVDLASPCASLQNRGRCVCRNLSQGDMFTTFAEGYPADLLLSFRAPGDNTIAQRQVPTTRGCCHEAYQGRIQCPQG